LNVTDGQTHLFGVYALDWDSQSRTETLDMLDPTTGNVLDSRTLSSFSGGVYVSWVVSGHVQLRVTKVSGPNAVLSGIFFDAPPGSLLPQAAYGFNEGSGSTVTDSSTNGITGTIQGAVWTTSGKYGSALSFNGISSYVDLGRPAALNKTGSMTWEAWVYATGTPADDAQIIALSDDSTGWQLKTTAVTGARTFAIAISADSTTRPQRNGKTAITLNTWYHVAGVYNAAAQSLDIWVNGVLDNGTLINGTPSSPTGIPSSQVLPASANVNIGRRTGGTGYYFPGTIDEVRVYNRALAQTEIQSDMSTPLPGNGAVVTLSPTSLDFGNRAINTTAVQQNVPLSNTGSGVLTITSISISGQNPTSYAQTNTCGPTLANGANCSITVSFAPVATGPLPATVSIVDSASVSPHSIWLSGVGTSGLVVSPRSAALTAIVTQQFSASMSGVTWSVDGVVGGSTTSGTITAGGLYTPPAPATRGTHTVTATVGASTANATAYITTYGGTFTRDITTMRTGLQANETVLSPANVSASTFGKVASYPIDGVSDASPLYVANVSVPGQGAHNIVYVATEHDSVYAFDADGRPSAPLWQVSFINPANGVTSVPPNDTGECCAIWPEIGITGSPVIDPSTNTLYVVAMTKETSPTGANFVHRLHALDITTGAEKFGGPVVIQASISGTGSGSVNGVLSFASQHQNQRPALLLSNGVVYVAFGAHGDVLPYHGWVFGYNPTTLAQVMVFCTSPNDPGTVTGGLSGGSGIWQSGDGLATDSTGNIYFVTGNGLFDVNTGGADYGDSLLKISPSGTVLDYFTPSDQYNMRLQDLDLGSGGVLLLPDQPGAHPHLALTAGKNGTIYLVDRDNMGHYNPNNDSQIVQTIVNIFPHGNANTGNFKAPVYSNGNLYYSADTDSLKSFSIVNGLLSTSPTSVSSLKPAYPGATLGVSADGTNNGILWAIERVAGTFKGVGPKGPGVLHAFDATNLTNELYNSNQSGSRDTLDHTAKWSAPLVANGKVYIAALSQLTVYGLLP
jgi:hypothetical protein